MRVLAFTDGTLADPDAPHLRVDDLGIMRGDGVFETILVVDGTPRELGPHLDRLARSAWLLGMPEPDAERWRRTCQLVIDNWAGGREMGLKLVYTRGPEHDPGAGPTGYALGFDISPAVIAKRAGGVDAVTLERGIDPGLAERAPWLLLGAKSLSYAANMAAMREAERRGADEAILLASDGSVLEGPTSTVVLAHGGTLYTPPASVGILPGTTQAALFRAAERAGWATKVEPLAADDLTRGDGLFVVSSVRTLTWVRSVDAAPLPDATELHGRLLAAYEAEYAR